MYRPLDRDRILSVHTDEQPASVAPLIPIMAIVLIAFLIIGLALPVLPLHVHSASAHLPLGLSPAASSARRCCRGCGQATTPIGEARSARLSLAC